MFPISAPQETLLRTHVLQILLCETNVSQFSHLRNNPREKKLISRSLSRMLMISSGDGIPGERPQLKQIEEGQPPALNISFDDLN